MHVYIGVYALISYIRNSSRPKSFDDCELLRNVFKVDVSLGLPSLLIITYSCPIEKPLFIHSFEVANGVTKSLY